MNNLSVVLFEPRIPQNTGNIARTCAAFRLPLILIEPLGFSLDDRYLKRAGLDYWSLLDISIYTKFSSFKQNLQPNQRIIGTSSRGDTPLSSMQFEKGDVLLFGREDNGLPKSIRDECSYVTKIGMPGGTSSSSPHGVRSLNLSVATAIVSFQAGLNIGLW